MLDGVYSDEQATRGQVAYTAYCSVCHGDALEGISAPQLTGNRFIERWREDTLDTIYDYIRQNMPRGRAPDSKPIPDSDYLDILTHILKMNGYRSWRQRTHALTSSETSCSSERMDRSQCRMARSS